MHEHDLTATLIHNILMMTEFLRHRFRVLRLVEDRQIKCAHDCVTNIASSCLETSIDDPPHFIYWLFIISLREIRKFESGFDGFDHLFESKPPRNRKAHGSFYQLLHAQVEAMDEAKQEQYRLRYEDGLILEETAAKLQAQLKTYKAAPAKPSNWLDEWKRFQMPETF
jgi:hypothetical protein